MSVAPQMLGRHVLATTEETEAFGRAIGVGLAAGDVVVLTGPLGAGKTTLTRGIADGLGVRGPVQSPTFVIARTHPSLVGGPPLVHVDAYRLGSALELDDLDLDAERSVIVVEWGRGMAQTLRERWWEIELERPAGGGAEAQSLDAGAPDAVSFEAGGPDAVSFEAGGPDAVSFEAGGPDAVSLDDDAPRVVTVSRRG